MKKIVIATMALFVAGSAFATMDLQKEYKAKKADAKCADCHTAAMPKKGAADLNDFGKTVKAAEGADKKIDWSKVK
jgi:mono/diheme cytochrome c family protein